MLALEEHLVQNLPGATNGTIQTNNGILQISTSTVNGGAVAVNGGSLQLSSSTVTPAGAVSMTGVSSLFVNNNSVLNAAVTNSGTHWNRNQYWRILCQHHQRQCD